MSGVVEVLCRLGGGCMDFCPPNHSIFRFGLDVFSFALHIRLSLPHPLTLNLTHCIYGQFLGLVRTYPLHYTHGGELIVFHNTIQNGLTSIVENMRFHVSHEQTYVLPSPSFQTFH